MTEKPRAADPGSTGSAPGGSAPAGQSSDEIEVEVEAPGVAGATSAPPVVDAPAEPVGTGAPALGAELEALRAELDERTRDLQRVSAEYANYRKRVDRDRGVQAEEATRLVISPPLP